MASSRRNCSSRQVSTNCRYSPTLFRSCFTSERRRLPSKSFRFKAGGLGDRCRRIFSRRETSARFFAKRSRSIASSNRARASFRLNACDRDSCTVTRSPVGRWRRVTAVETLFTGGEKMTVWVSDDPNHFPLRIESPIVVGTVKVDMMGYRNNRYPLTSLISFR